MTFQEAVIQYANNRSAIPEYERNSEEIGKAISQLIKSINSDGSYRNSDNIDRLITLKSNLKGELEKVDTAIATMQKLEKLIIDALEDTPNVEIKVELREGNRSFVTVVYANEELQIGGPYSHL